MQLVLSPVAARAIRNLSPGVKRGVRAALRFIEKEPTCGDPLHRELAGYFKFRVRRFRIVYTIDRVKRVVRVVAVGPRATIYEQVAEHLRSDNSRPDRR